MAVNGQLEQQQSGANKRADNQLAIRRGSWTTALGVREVRLSRSTSVTSPDTATLLATLLTYFDWSH